MMRCLIVNADDFGQSVGINRGIIEAHERGIVTSASLMVHGEAVAEAAEYARVHPQLSVGLHLDLCEWACDERANESAPAGSAWNPEWRLVYERCDCANPRVVEEEIYRQLSRYRDLLHREPTHLDSHQHVHLDGVARTVLQRLAREIDVPLRHYAAVSYEGAFYGQTSSGRPLPEQILPAALMALIQSLPAGVTELGCHPGYADDLAATMYRRERSVEVRTLCDPGVRRALQESGVMLISFADIGSDDATRIEGPAASFSIGDHA